jgi:hypothetical protein
VVVFRKPWLIPSTVAVSLTPAASKLLPSQCLPALADYRSLPLRLISTQSLEACAGALHRACELSGRGPLPLATVGIGNRVAVRFRLHQVAVTD